MVEGLLAGGGGDVVDCTYGACGKGLRGTASVRVEELAAIGGSGYADLALSGNRGVVGLAHGGEFLGTGLHVQAAAAAVVADTVVRTWAVGAVVVDDVALVDVVNTVDVYVGDSAVVVEVVVVPVAAEVAEAYVAKAVVDPAVIADVGAPVAAVKGVAVVVITPVGRGPEGAVIRRSAPYAGYPVVPCVGVVPIAGGPDVVIFGRGWLVVLGQRRRRLLGVHEGLLAGFFGVGVALRVGIVAGLVVVVALVAVALLVAGAAGLGLRNGVVLRGLGAGGGLADDGRGRLTLIALAAALPGVGLALAQDLCSVAAAGCAAGVGLRDVGGGGVAGRGLALGLVALATSGAEGEDTGKTGQGGGADSITELALDVHG